jgi:glycerophosphoryl diester phosphodiesterase
MASFPFLDWPGPAAFAHRGAHGVASPDGAGENTMAAFEAAIALGYRFVETDAHVTADGVLVAFHDHELDRVTDRTGEIGDLVWSEVAKARVGEAGDGVPLLEDLLTAWPDVRVNIDPKHDAAVEPLADLVRRTGTLDRVCFGAFSDKRLARLRSLLGPGTCTSMGPRAVRRLLVASRGVPAGRFGSACVQVPPSQGRMPLVTERFVTTAHDRGLPVHVWTIDDPVEMARLLDLGVDGIMTDRPDLLKDVLVARGQWVGP